LPFEKLVSLGKLRWRIEQDYHELEDALGLDHFEGRTYRGWHHHVTPVAVRRRSMLKVHDCFLLAPWVGEVLFPQDY
jgi:SRSO17 transposase